MTQQLHARTGLLMVTEAGVENDGAVSGAAGLTAGVPVSGSPGPGTGSVAADAGREDLTVFFSIGIVVDVLLVTVFLVWAVRQWRKSGK